MRQVALLGVLLAVVFGRDALSGLLERAGGGGGASAPTLDVDRGLSAEGRVHISFCTS